MKLLAMKFALLLWLALLPSFVFAEVSVEYQGVEVFVQKSGDVRIVYEFVLMGSGQEYQLLPVTLPRERVTAKLKAYARQESQILESVSEPFQESAWTSIAISPSNDKSAEHDILLDISGFQPEDTRPVRVRLEAEMPQLAVVDGVCPNMAGVYTGFTSFADPDKSGIARWRIHLPEGTPSDEVIAYRSLNNKYAPILPRNEAEHVVLEWEARGLPGYYWIYTMLPAKVFTSPLKPDWRYTKDSEPRSLPLEVVKMDVWIEPDNDTRMESEYSVTNTHSCVPLQNITYELADRGSASATMNGQKLESTSSGRRRKTYVFSFPGGVPVGDTARARIQADYSYLIHRNSDDPSTVLLGFSPEIFASRNRQPGSRYIVRIMLFPDTDLQKVQALTVPFSGTGTVQGRPYVYWELEDIQYVGVQFPRGPLRSFEGYYDFSRPSDWLAIILEIRGVQIFLIITFLIVFFSKRGKIFRSKRRNDSRK